MEKFRSPRRQYGEGNGTPLQYSCLENPMDEGAWKAAVHEVAEGRTRLSDFTFTPWRRKWQPTPVFLPGESQGRRSLVGCHLWVTQSRTRLKWLSSSSSKIHIILLIICLTATNLVKRFSEKIWEKSRVDRSVYYVFLGSCSIKPTSRKTVVTLN